MTMLAPPEIHAVTPQQNEVLEYVIGAGRVTVRDAAARLGIDTRNSRRRLEALVRRRFLERHDGGDAHQFSARIGLAELSGLEVRALRGVELTGLRGATVNPQTAPRKATSGKVVAAPFNAKETPLCPPHHMVIESPKGTTMIGGTCRKCGYSREYVAAATEVLGNLPMVFPPAEKTTVIGGAIEGGRVSRSKHPIRQREASHTWGGAVISKESQTRAADGARRAKQLLAVASSK